MQSSTKKVIGFVAAAAALVVAAVFLYRTAPPPEFVSTVVAEAQTGPTGATAVPAISSSQAITAEDRLGPAKTMPPPVTMPPSVRQNDELPAPAASHPRLGRPQTLPESPYTPSPEEQQRFDELKAGAYSSGMTMSKLLKREEFVALPEPMQKQLFRDLVTMAMRGELNRQQFLEEPPAQ